MAAGQIKQKGALNRELAQIHYGRLYRDQGRAILAYALRRVEDPEDAADVVAETFLVAWRRLGEVPLGEEGRLWLYAVARRVIANLHRAERRRTRLGQRLAESMRIELATQPAPAGEGAEVLRAMGGLGDDDRELLLLVSWEELSPGEAAKVLGISSLAARSRLHRARRRLRALLEQRESALRHGHELDMEEANENA
jgi:RNA polymerase sigma factor (sigma-70 family)